MQFEKQGCVLSDIPNFGRVFDCGFCGNIHLTIGSMTLLLTPDEYLNLVTMIHTSASHFEVWLEQKRGITSEMPSAVSDFDRLNGQGR